MKSRTSSRIIIIHPSFIIREGLATMIKEIFHLESLLIEKTELLDNYLDISDQKLIFIVDEKLHETSFLNKAEHFKLNNDIKSIIIRDPNSPSECEPNCNCCFNTHVPKIRLESLLRPLIEPTSKNAKINQTTLTEREIEVVKLVALGKTNKEIANELCISIHTVISHRKNITEKLGIKSISGLTVYAILNHFIDADNIDPESLI